MSMDVNSPINLDDNFKSDVFYNSYGGINIYNSGYEAEKIKFNKPHSKFSKNIGGENEESSGENLEIHENLFNVDRDDFGYFKTINYDIEIPQDLESIPNSKVHKREHKKIELENVAVKNVVQATLPPGFSEKATVMNYSERPRFKFTITQQPKENIPIINNYMYTNDFNLEALADYKP